MAVDLLISALPGEIRAAVRCDGALQDFLVLRAAPPGADAAVQAGDRFLARVRRFDKGLDGAFVDLGLERDALLPTREAPEGIPPEGATLAVRVLRAPAAGKGARVSAKGVTANISGMKAPARLPADEGALEALLRTARPARVVADDAALLQSLKATGVEAAFALYSDARPLFEAEGLEEQVEALLVPRVTLAGGGFLLIEPGQTLTAIDVNAGRHEGRGGAAAQARAVNRAAVPEIARQLRLRALSGLIVVDFLAMKAPDDRKAVAAALRDAVAGDPEPCQVFGLSPSGLLEMTRRRGRPPLHELLCRPCGLAGSGREKTPETLAYEALRRVVAEVSGKVLVSVTLRVPPAVATVLGGPQAAAALAAVERRLGRAVHVEPDPLEPAYAVVLK